MGRQVKKISIKSRTFYFYNDMINLEDFESNLLQKTLQRVSIYYIGYIRIKKINDCESIYSVNLLYLHFNYANEYIEEKNGNKYLAFDSTDENKELQKNTQMFGMELKRKLKQ